MGKQPNDEIFDLSIWMSEPFPNYRKHATAQTRRMQVQCARTKRNGHGRRQARRIWLPRRLRAEARTFHTQYMVSTMWECVTMGRAPGKARQQLPRVCGLGWRQWWWMSMGIYDALLLPSLEGRGGWEGLE
jgi:hypothetical protein